MLAVEARRRIRASVEHVFAYLAHPEHLPRYAAPLWMAADAPEKRGNTHLATLRGYFIGLPVEAVVKVTPHHSSSLELTQIHGTLRAFSGRFTVRSVEDGTEMLYHVEADPGIPMLSDDAARQFLVQHVERLLDRIKLAAERKAPSRRPRAVAPPSAAAPPGLSPPSGGRPPGGMPTEAEDEEVVEEATSAPFEGGTGPEVSRHDANDAASPPSLTSLPSAHEASHEMPAPERPSGVRPPAGQAHAEGEARLEGAPSGRRRRRRRRRRRHGPSAPSPGA